MVKTTSANGGPDQTYPSDTERIAYTPEDIQTMLGVKRSAVYNFLAQVYRDHGPFLVHKIGTMYRIPKESIDKRRKNNQNGDFTNGQFVLSLKWLIVESYKKETT